MILTRNTLLATDSLSDGEEPSPLPIVEIPIAG
jgi:hypothetical protein